MNIIQSMIHEKLGEVRIIRSEDGNPMNTLFCATDVCRALCYNENNIRTVISRQCSGVTKRDATDSIGRVQSINFIPLYDVFALIYNSRKPEAIEFRDWVNKDVLPSLYQFGTYIAQDHINNLQFTNPEFTFKDSDVAEQSFNKNNIIGVNDSVGECLTVDATNIVNNIGQITRSITNALYEQMTGYFGMRFDNLEQNQQNMNERISNIENKVDEFIIPAILNK